MLKSKLPRRTFVRGLITAAAAAAALRPGSIITAAKTPRGKAIHVQDLNLDAMSTGWGRVHRNASVGKNPLHIGGKHFSRGIGTHALSTYALKLQGQAAAFSATIGVDSEVGDKGAVIFELVGDGRELAKSPVLRGGQAAVTIHADLRGVNIFEMIVRPATDNINFDHADWINPTIYMKPGSNQLPVPLTAIGPMPVLAHGDPETPQFHGARVTGGSPGKPFMFRIPYTGAEPVTLTADGLPTGLSLRDGLIAGEVSEAGEFKVKLTAENRLGKAHRTLRIMIGQHMIARTPAMGWNSWNAYGMANSAARTKAAADAFIRLGLAAKGYTYVNIDDGWQNGRNMDGTIKTTKKFGDMKALADYVHSKGLKFGLYSSPGPETCGGHTGSYQHETKDADTYASWGVDYLKYDWCSYHNIDPNPDLEGFIKPYRIMGEALRATSRDIFFSLCQYGMGHVWTWAGKAPVYGNSYRISGDINDSWGAMTANGFGSNGDLYPFAGPGHWNDPDMLVVGWGYFEDGPLHWSKLTPNEQVTHFTLWCMQAAPLLLGCDLDHMNTFTLDLISNTEVLAVNQDELGVQAQRVSRKGDAEVWARPLFDGTVAVALFNRGILPANVSVSWAELRPVIPGGTALSGKQSVRDLWQRKALGVFDGYTANVNPHGAIMLKIGTPVDTD